MGHKHGGFEGVGECGHDLAHVCPICGLSHGVPRGEWYEGGAEALRPGKLARIAAKKLLIDKLKSKMEARWSDKFDEIAEEIIEAVEAKKKMKIEHRQRKSKIKERFKEILAEGISEEEGEKE